jgi:hypothetical protein
MAIDTTLPADVAALGNPTAIYNKDQSGKTFSLIAGIVCLVIAAGIVFFALNDTSGSSRRRSSSDDNVGAAVVGGGLFGFFALLAFLNWNGKRTPGSVMLTEQGVAYMQGEGANAKATTARWDEVNGITQAITKHYRNGVYTGTTYLYTLFLTGGRKMTFNNSIANVEMLGEALQNEVSRRAMPIAAAAYNSGQPVNFGPLTVSRDGLTQGKKTLAWGEIEGVQIQNGYIAVKKQGGWFNWANVPAASVVNLYVFLNLVNQIVGIKPGR